MMDKKVLVAVGMFILALLITLGLWLTESKPQRTVKTEPEVASTQAELAETTPAPLPTATVQVPVMKSLPLSTPEEVQCFQSPLRHRMTLKEAIRSKEIIPKHRVVRRSPTPSPN